MDPREEAARARLTAARRIVVKVGTRLLAGERGRPERTRINKLVRELAALHRAGKEVVLVTSGAVGMGMDALSLTKRPERLPELQMAAAVGQARLMALYGEAFGKAGIVVGQVLLTHGDLNVRSRHLNARNAMMHLLRSRIIPIVNENDVVSVDEIKVGDNDVLAALTALLIDADALVLLTTVNGLRRSSTNARSKRISFLERVEGEALSLAKGKASAISTGGMATKLAAAQSAADAGRPTIIADGRAPRVLAQIFAGGDVGTIIAPAAPRGSASSARKRWIAFFHRAKGTVVIDRGAAEALERRGRSLLPAGICGLRGSFDAGTLVNIEGEDGRLIARGLVDYSSADISKVMGKKTSEIAAILGRRDYDEVIHRDNMVLLKDSRGESDSTAAQGA